MRIGNAVLIKLGKQNVRLYGTRDFGAYNVAEPVTSAPVTSIYCTGNSTGVTYLTLISCNGQIICRLLFQPRVVN